MNKQQMIEKLLQSGTMEEVIKTKNEIHKDIPSDAAGWVAVLEPATAEAQEKYQQAAEVHKQAVEKIAGLSGQALVEAKAQAWDTICDRWELGTYYDELYELTSDAYFLSDPENLAAVEKMNSEPLEPCDEFPF